MTHGPTPTGGPPSPSHCGLRADPDHPDQARAIALAEIRRWREEDCPDLAEQHRPTVLHLAAHARLGSVCLSLDGEPAWALHQDLAMAILRKAIGRGMRVSGVEQIGQAHDARVSEADVASPDRTRSRATMRSP